MHLWQNFSLTFFGISRLYSIFSRFFPNCWKYPKEFPIYLLKKIYIWVDPCSSSLCCSKFTLYFKIWHVENIPRQLTHFQICWLGRGRVIGIEKSGMEEAHRIFRAPEYKGLFLFCLTFKQKGNMEKLKLHE